MKIVLSLVALTFAGTLSFRFTFAQSIAAVTSPPTGAVTITEPGKISLEQLFKMSKVVAVVQIVSGDRKTTKLQSTKLM